MRLSISFTGFFVSADGIRTDKYEGTIHVLFQAINLSVIVILSFIFEESPEGIRISVEVPYHTWVFRVLFRCRS